MCFSREPSSCTLPPSSEQPPPCGHASRRCRCAELCSPALPLGVGYARQTLSPPEAPVVIDLCLSSVWEWYLPQTPAGATFSPNEFLESRSSFSHRVSVVLESYISRLFSENKLVKNKSQVWQTICHRSKDTVINLCIRFKCLIKQWKKRPRKQAEMSCTHQLPEGSIHQG